MELEPVCRQLTEAVVLLIQEKNDAAWSVAKAPDIDNRPRRCCKTVNTIFLTA